MYNNKMMKKVIAFTLAAAIILGGKMAMPHIAASVSRPIWIDLKNPSSDPQNGIEVSDDVVTLSGEGKAYKLYKRGNRSIEITSNMTVILSNARISASKNTSGIAVAAGVALTLLIEGDNRAEGNGEGAGIHIPETATLEIDSNELRGSTQGVLTANGGISSEGVGSAGIGGVGTHSEKLRNEKSNSGKITISGGAIIANGGQGGYGGAGIGGGGSLARGGDAADVIIQGGANVKAIGGRGGNRGADIGGGGGKHSSGSGGQVRITGGSLKIEDNAPEHSAELLDENDNPVYPLSVTVTNSAAAPLADVKITISAQDCSYTAYTDEEGKACIWRTDGTYDIALSKDDYEQKSDTVTVAAHHENSYTTSLEKDSLPQAPTLEVTPDNHATDVEISGSIVIAFSGKMNPNQGSVSINEYPEALSAGYWNNENTIYTVGYSGLAYNTAYTIMIENFEDEHGNKTDPTPYTSVFTTKGQPSGPDVSPSKLDLDLTRPEGGALTIFFGENGSTADYAEITVSPPHENSISVSEYSLAATAGVTSMQVTVSAHKTINGATLQVVFSGGNLDDAIMIPVSVNVTDSGNSENKGGNTRNPKPDKNVDKASSGITLPSGKSSSGSSRRAGGRKANSLVYHAAVSNSPNQSTMATEKAKAKVTESRAAYRITDSMVRKLMEQARQDAKKAGKTADGIGIKVNLQFPAAAQGMAITVDENAVKRMSSATDLKLFAIGNPLVDISFNKAAIKQLYTRTTGTVTIVAAPEHKLSRAAAALIGSRPAFDVFVSYKKNGETRFMRNFKSGKVTLGIAYKPSNGERTGNLYAVSDTGARTYSSYTNGRVIFSRKSLTPHGVGYKAQAPVFRDTQSHCQRDNIDFAASRGLIAGTGAGMYSPDNAVTRGVFVAALGRLSGHDMSGYATSGFSDVPADSPLMPYVKWAVAENITADAGGGKFNPNGKITREEMAVMLYRYIKATKYTLPVTRKAVDFSDASKISASARDAVKALQQAGILSGPEDGRFSPKNAVTRAEAATVLRNLVELVIDPKTQS